MDEKLDNGMTRVWAIWNYVEAIILVAAGVLACVFCNNEGLRHRRLRHPRRRASLLDDRLQL